MWSLIDKLIKPDNPEIYVVGVDKAATKDFVGAIRKKATELGFGNLRVKLVKKYGKIPPRVVGTTTNPKFEDVATKLPRQSKKLSKKTSATNTLQKSQSPATQSVSKNIKD